MAEDKELIYVIKINTDDSVKSVKTIKDELKSVKTALDTVAQGSENFKILDAQFQKLNNDLRNVGVEAGSIGAIKNEIKELNEELAKVKIDSPEYNSLIQKLGVAKNTLADFNQETKALGADFSDKLKAFTQLGAQIAGGFNIATGALSLFGEENKDLEKAIQQSVAAMQILQGVQALTNTDNLKIVQRVLGWKATSAAIDGATKAQVVNNAATQSGVIGFKALRASIIATGIGLLVVALGEIVNRWDDIKKAFGGFEIFKSLGKVVDETRQRFVGAFYAILNSIKPVATFLKDYFLTPIKLVIDSIKVLGTVLEDPFNIDNLKKGANDIGNLFVDAKDKLIKDVKDIGNAFNEGFDSGIGIEKARQAAAARKELTEKEIKDLEQSVQFLKEGSDKRLKVELDIINKKLSITKKSDEEYKKLLVEQFKAQEAIKDKNLETQKENAKAREDEFKKYEDAIKSAAQTAENDIEVNASVKINAGGNEAEIEAQKEVQLTQVKLAELNARKINYQNYQKDVSTILSEIALAETNLITKTRELNSTLADIEFNQDTANTEKFVNDQTAIIKQGYLDQLKALEDSNLSVEEKRKQQEQIEKDYNQKLVELKNEEFKQKIQSQIDYGKSSTALIVEQTDFEISETERKLKEQAALEKKAEDEAIALAQQKIGLIQEISANGQQLLIDILYAQQERQYTQELDLLNDKYVKEKNILDEKLKRGLISEDQANKKKKELDEKAAKERRKLDREAAIDKRNIALIQVAISTASNSIEQPGPYGSLIPYWVALGAIEAASIYAQPLPALKKGGILNDELINAKGGKLLTGSQIKGTSTSDSNLALLSKGESVINARSTAMFLPLLSKINEMGGGVKFKFAEGGLNQFSSSASQLQSFNTTNTTFVDNSRMESLLEQLVNTKVKAYVVSSEMTDQQNEDATISGRASW